ncbi:MAG: sel1 repeat family protein, partial [Planctomycetaceae bacterium]|nr:sel1 repeat family protein [Planctomycetaceae bacterium]
MKNLSITIFVMTSLILTTLIAGDYDKTTAAEPSLQQLIEKAKNGDAAAQFTLGLCYYDGKGVTKDLIEAVKWYRKAAEQGNSKAQYILGLC